MKIGLSLPTSLILSAMAGMLFIIPTRNMAAPEPVSIEDGQSSLIDGTKPSMRMEALRNFCASMDPEINHEPRAMVIPLAARIYCSREVESSLAKWEEIASAVYNNSRKRLEANPKDNNARNPFEKHALIHAYLVCKDKVSIPTSLVEEMKKYVALYKHREWIGYGALNYRLMNDGSGFIAAELWPDLKDSDGLDADGIKAATKARLLRYFDDIVHNNTDEYGAPTYLGIDLGAMKMLTDFAQDAEVKKKAALTLDSMLLQVACAWNHGYYITPASRAKYWGSSTTCPESMDTTATVGWLYFRALRPVNAAHTNPGGSFWFAVPGRYNPPDIFTAIANDRSTAFTHRGSAHDKFRFTIYHTPGYSLASEWELLATPEDGHYKESRRQMFKWVSDHPHSTFVPLQDNIMRPYKPKDITPNAFGYGENAFSQSLQNEGTLIGISSVPKDYPFWKMYAPFTRDGAILKRIEKGGWVFCHGGSVLFGFRYAQPASWGNPRDKENCDIFMSDSRNNGWVLETSPVHPYVGGGIDAELGRFAEAILANTSLDASAIDADKPALSYRSLTGHQLKITFRKHAEPYADQQMIDGKPVDYLAFPLFGNPWVTQQLGGDTLKINHGGKTLQYDFKAWNCTDGSNITVSKI